jgi:hypothetical protein
VKPHAVAITAGLDHPSLEAARAFDLEAGEVFGSGVIDRADEVRSPVADPRRSHRLQPPRERRADVGGIAIDQDVTYCAVAEPLGFKGVLEPVDRLGLTRIPGRKLHSHRSMIPGRIGAGGAATWPSDERSC